MTTKALYLTDMCLLNCSAQVVKVTVEGERSTVILDQTVFHPQGGGQPSDKGTMKNKEIIFDVQNVSKEDGVVFHNGVFTSGQGLKEGDAVELEVEPELRKLHCRNHTAGHIIDYAMINLGYTLEPSKAYHYPQGPYVEYIGTLEQEERDALVQKLEREANKLVAEGLPVRVEFTDNDPKKRSMIAGDYRPIPCGGTHVINTADIGHITIRKIKNEKGNLRVSYAV